MSSKFAKFLEDNEIDPRRVLSASAKLEKLRPEDRAIRLKKRAGGDEDAPAAADGDEGEAAPPPKPRSGRPVTTRLLREATEGAAIKGPAKTRLLRAVNHVLEQKKKDPVDIRTLF